jgi:hypothetical protein
LRASLHAVVHAAGTAPPPPGSGRRAVAAALAVRVYSSLMRRSSQMNPTCVDCCHRADRGLVIALNLYVTLAALYAIAGIAPFHDRLVYLLWRAARRSKAGRSSRFRRSAARSALSSSPRAGALFSSGNPWGLDAPSVAARPLGVGVCHVARLARLSASYGY